MEIRKRTKIREFNFLETSPILVKVMCKNEIITFRM
jgi:hypothetical protein